VNQDEPPGRPAEPAAESSGAELGGAELGGAELGGAFHRQVVGPLIGRALPRLRYAAARLGSGSDVLGLDDAMSRDHDWGLRLTVLVDEADRAAAAPLGELLARDLPDQFRGRPVRFATSWDAAAVPQVQVATVGDFAVSRLGVNPLAGLSSLDWLILTGQSVLELVAGPVYADSTTELGAVRRALAWYPADVERYVLACGWQRVEQRLPFVGRTAETGQPLQSRLVCAGLASDLVSLAFLLHRRWQPYEKWREALLARLPGSDELAGALLAAVSAPGWSDREAALVAAIEALAAVQRRAGLPVPDPVVERFYDRPYRTLNAALPGLLLGGISDRVLARLRVRGGSVSQWADSVDVLADPGRRAALAAVYPDWLGPDSGPEPGIGEPPGG
jgi:Domain of unknown function (DUF4037)